MSASVGFGGRATLPAITGTLCRLRDRADGVDDALRVAVRRVDDDARRRRRPPEPRRARRDRAWADGRADAQAALPSLIAERVAVGLEEVLDRDEPEELARRRPRAASRCGSCGGAPAPGRWRRRAAR